MVSHSSYPISHFLSLAYKWYKGVILILQNDEEWMYAFLFFVTLNLMKFYTMPAIFLPNYSFPFDFLALS
jgi:hypothetical protein